MKFVHIDNQLCPSTSPVVDINGWCKSCHDISSNSGSCCEVGASEFCCKNRDYFIIIPYAPIIEDISISFDRVSLRSFNCLNPDCTSVNTFDITDWSTLF